MMRVVAVGAALGVLAAACRPEAGSALPDATPTLRATPATATPAPDAAPLPVASSAPAAPQRPPGCPPAVSPPARFVDGGTLTLTPGSDARLTVPPEGRARLHGAFRLCTEDGAEDVRFVEEAGAVRLLGRETFAVGQPTGERDVLVLRQDGPREATVMQVTFMNLARVSDDRWEGAAQTFAGKMRGPQWVALVRK